MKVKRKNDLSLFERFKIYISDKFYCLTQPLLSKITKKNDKNKGLSSRRIKESIFYYGFLILPLLQFCVFYIFVNFNSFLLAFKKYDMLGAGFQWCGFDNFRNVFIELQIKNGPLINSFLNSIKSYFLGYVLIPLNLLLPYYIYKKRRGSEFFKVILFLPSILSVMVIGLLYQYCVDQVLPEIFKSKFNIIIPPLLSDTSTRFMTAWFFGVLTGFGTGILLYSGAMSRIPVSVVEYARLEGLGLFREFISITLPLIFPTVSTIYLLGIAGIFVNQMNLFTFFGSGSSITTIGYYTYNLVVSGNGFYNYPLASTIGLFATCIIAPITFLVRYLINKFTPDVDY